MTDRPALMSAPMVRALLREIEQPGSGKTQTRRPAWQAPKVFMRVGDGPAEPIMVPTIWQSVKPGDRLWVRETWMTSIDSDGGLWRYAADYDADGVAGMRELQPWKPSIHMPRWASRLTLIVTDTKMERVQEISEEDAIAEGVYFQEPTADDLEWYQSYAEERGIDPATDPMQGVWMAPGTRQGWGMTKAERNREQWGPTAEFAYRCIWQSLYTKPGVRWEDNPEVVAVTFVPHLCNVDAMAAVHLTWDEESGAELARVKGT